MNKNQFDIRPRYAIHLNMHPGHQHHPAAEGGGLSTAKVLGVLAGADMPLPLLAAWARSADVLVAADSAADRLLEIGLSPDKVIGDLDSISDQARSTLENVLHNPDPELTDCDKLLRLVEDLGHKSVTLAGVEGDLLDHVLASLHSAIRSPLEVRLALRKGLGWVLRGPVTMSVPSQPGSRVSLMPLMMSELKYLRGVQWPLEKVELTPLGQTSISNIAVSKTVEVELGSGAAMLFVGLQDQDVPAW